jgi:hypothetical protein
MLNTLRTIWIVTIITAGIVSTSNAGTWTLLTCPGATSTSLTGIDGQNIVATFDDSSYNTHGALYNGTNWKILDYPRAQYTTTTGINGNTVIGYSNIGGFTYNNQNWTSITIPGFTAYPEDMDGSNIIGHYWASNKNNGFLYNGTNFTTLNYSGGDYTFPAAMSGTKIVGYYCYVGSTMHGFMYESGKWTVLNFPGSSETWLTDIDGTNIVGTYKNSSGTHGLIYDGTNWTTLDYPGTSITGINGIDGQNIVGYCRIGSEYKGFVYTIPEPCTLLLLGLGAAILRKKARN